MKECLLLGAAVVIAVGGFIGVAVWSAMSKWNEIYKNDFYGQDEGIEDGHKQEKEKEE